MKKKSDPLKFIWIICFVVSAHISYAQDSTSSILIDTTHWVFNSDFYNKTVYPELSAIYHYPSKKEKQNIKWYHYLLKEQPSEKNHIQYYQLACSYWNEKRTGEAEKMFLKIITSTGQFYTSTYYNSSDVPGDTTKNIYGYGSYTFNYKNGAALYLVKIYIEQKRFEEALKYVNDAVKKYKTTYSCGTGYQFQKDEYDFLYASCYLGLDKDKKAIDLLLPQCLERSANLITQAIKKLYTQSQVDTILFNAERSVSCHLDTYPSFSYQIITGKNNKEKTVATKYYSGTATVQLFGRKINIPAPDLKNGQHITKEDFIKVFKESDFYSQLKG